MIVLTDARQPRFGTVKMKKTYEKPTLVKRQRLTERTAQIVASGVVLGE